MGKDRVKAAQVKRQEALVAEEEAKTDGSFVSAVYTTPSFTTLSSLVLSADILTVTACYWDPVKAVPE